MSKFPHIHRLIAAFTLNRFKKIILLSASITFFAVYISYTVQYSRSTHFKEKTSSSESTQIESGFLPPHPAPLHIEDQLKDWEALVQKQPGYRDGYLYIAALSFQLRKIPQSQQAIQKALDIDPNFEPALRLKAIIDEYEKE